MPDNRAVLGLGGGVMGDIISGCEVRGEEVMIDEVKLWVKLWCSLKGVNGVRG